MPSSSDQRSGGASPSGSCGMDTWVRLSSTPGILASVTLMAGALSTSSGPSSLPPMTPNPLHPNTLVTEGTWRRTSATTRSYSSANAELQNTMARSGACEWDPLLAASWELAEVSKAWAVLASALVTASSTADSIFSLLATRVLHIIGAFCSSASVVEASVPGKAESCCFLLLLETLDILCLHLASLMRMNAFCEYGGAASSIGRNLKPVSDILVRQPRSIQSPDITHSISYQQYELVRIV
mmetsp:Transcript_38716/g.86105  ORF Transcript_38716/g.86105 Transcript_38716/m.86105 type:complete len:241 (-) Transcript_38716:1-723(-)